MDYRFSDRNYNPSYYYAPYYDRWLPYPDPNPIDPIHRPKPKPRPPTPIEEVYGPRPNNRSSYYH